MVVLLEVRRAGGKAEVLAEKVSMVGLKPGADVDLEAARWDVEGNATTRDSGVVVAKDAGEANSPKEAFAIEMFPMIEMRSREDAIVAVELALGNGERGAAENAREVGCKPKNGHLGDGRESIEAGCVGHNGPPGEGDDSVQGRGDDYVREWKA